MARGDGPAGRRAEVVRDIGLNDKRRVPASVLTPTGWSAAAAMAWRGLELGTALWDRLVTARRCSALLTGVGAHANTPIPSVAGAVTALLLGALAHRPGWPIPVGGSQAITDAMIADLVARGVSIECGRRVDRVAALPPARAYLFDTSPWTVAAVFGERLPTRYRRALGRYRPGNGVAKVDFALSRSRALGRPPHRCGGHRPPGRGPRPDDSGRGRHRRRPAQPDPGDVAQSAHRGRPISVRPLRATSVVDLCPRPQRLDPRHDRDGHYPD